MTAPDHEADEVKDQEETVRDDKATLNNAVNQWRTLLSESRCCDHDMEGFCLACVDEAFAAVRADAFADGRRAGVEAAVGVLDGAETRWRARSHARRGVGDESCHEAAEQAKSYADTIKSLLTDGDKEGT